GGHVHQIARLFVRRVRAHRPLDECTLRHRSEEASEPLMRGRRCRKEEADGRAELHLRIDSNKRRKSAQPMPQVPFSRKPMMKRPSGCGGGPPPFKRPPTHTKTRASPRPPAPRGPRPQTAPPRPRATGP